MRIRPLVLTLLLISIALLTSGLAHGQVGPLLWEENFDTLDTSRWTVDTGDGCSQGICGWGNQELQSYGTSNVRIEPVPGEPGNSALVLEARRETAGGSAFTSGKIKSENKLAVQYGMVEIRLRVPDLETGLWPAAWMLGTSTATWPAKGEIDIMEMGHSFAGRDRQGYGSTPPNRYVGSNLIFYADEACVPENPTCAASSSWDVTYNTPYAASTSLAGRFAVYRLYWTDTDIQFSVTDGGVEHFLHATPFAIGGAAAEFQAPFFFLLNLAVGGNFTDAATNAQVTAPLPTKMYVDYIRVYEYNGLGQILAGNVTPPETGTFGVFTDTTPTDNELVAGVSSDIWVWDPTTGAGTTTPREGSEVIAWQVQSGGWFGGGIQSRQPRDLSNFADGDLHFSIRLPADVPFRVGITDTYTNEHWITFPANQTTYGLVRNGEWGEAVIPMADLRGPLVAIQSLSYPFAIAADPPASTFQLGIDDIYYTGGGSSDPDSDGDGVADSIDQCPGTPPGTPVDGVGCPVQDSLTGLTVTGPGAIEFFVDTSGWADVHYTIDGGPMLNVRMIQSSGRNTLALSGLSSGTVIAYSFTYWDTDGGFAIDTPTATHTISGGSTASPVQVEAEDYTAFADVDPGNNGGAYRSDAVDLEATSDAGGGYNVGWTAAGEWLEYSVTLAPGTYAVTARVASLGGGGSYTVSLDGASIGSDSVGDTGGWQAWQTHGVGSVNVGGGTYTLRVDITGAGFNLNWLRFDPM